MLTLGRDDPRSEDSAPRFDRNYSVSGDLYVVSGVESSDSSGVNNKREIEVGRSRATPEACARARDAAQRYEEVSACQ